LLLVWLVSAIYVFPFRLRGWIPPDDGVLAQSAEHVLNGEMPHRDFPDIYTGGLSYWNALALRLFGIRLASLRWMLYLSFLAFVPAVFAVARRFGSPLASGLITLLAVAWSVPNHFEAVPSWYNLFLAAWGVLALLRHVETGQSRWLFLAGLLGGVSCLFKVIGAHFIAASLLFFVYRERDLSASASSTEGKRRVSGYLLFVTAGLGLFLAVLFLTVRSHLHPMEFVHFVVPASLLCGFLIWREASGGAGSLARRFPVLMSLILPFAYGALVPVLLFLVPFALGGALGDLWQGVVEGTGAHLQFIQEWMPPLSALLPGIPYTIVLCAGSLRPIRFAGPLLALLGTILAGALWLSGGSPDAYRTVWYSVRSLGVSAVLAACLRLIQSYRQGFWTPEVRQKIFLLAAVVAVTSLVQFPFALPLYFCYFAPLVALLIFALVGSELGPPWPVHATVFAYYLFFALLWINTGYVFNLGRRFERYDPRVVLDLPRAGGIRVSEEDAVVFSPLIRLVQEKSGGRPIYAGPDSPEIHFLSGLPDAISYGPGSPRNPMERAGEVYRSLAKTGSRVAVLKFRSEFFNHRPPVLARFEELFPHARAFGRFVVRWRG
jgi:hypothetical protein